MRTGSLFLFAASLVGVMANSCDTGDQSAIANYETCVLDVATCAETVTALAPISSCLCSYAKAVISCASSACGDSGTLFSAGQVISSEYCAGDFNFATATATTTDGNGLTATPTPVAGTAAATATSSAGADIKGYAVEIVVVAVVGLVGVMV